ncbi:TonB-dependent receptor domain-containing protein, partial [Bacteroidota bacterium]
YSNYVNENTLLQLQVSTLNSKWDASGQIPDRAVKSGQITRWGAIDSEEGGFTERTNVLLKSFQRIGNESYLKNQIFFTHYNFELYSNFTFYLNNPQFGDQIRQKENRQIFGYHGEYLKGFHIWGNELNNTVGWGIRYDRVNNLELSNTIHRKTDLESLSMGDVFETNGWFYLDEIYEAGKFMLNAGLRYDYLDFNYVDHLSNSYRTLSKGKGIFSPKLNLFYNANPFITIYLKSGRGFHSNDTRVVVAGLIEETLPAATGIDVGGMWKPVGSILLDLSLWYMYLEQEFVYVGDEAVVEPGNASVRQGIDFSIRWQAINWLFFDWDINLADPHYPELPEGENHIPLAPEISSMGGLTFISSIGLNGGLRYRYIKDRPANEDNSVVALGYFVTDINLNYKRSIYDIGISVENLFNTEWNEAQFDTQSRLRGELVPVSELHYTPGYPFFAKLYLAFRF